MGLVMRGLRRRLRGEWRESLVLGPSSESGAPDKAHLSFVESDTLQTDAELGDLQWYAGAGGLVQFQAEDIATAIGVNKAARTATAAPGGTTGVIADGTTFVTVTSDDANKVITLPTPTPGARVELINGGTGYELRSSAPATVGING